MVVHELVHDLVVPNASPCVMRAIFVCVELLVAAADLVEHRETCLRRAYVVHQSDVDDDRALYLVHEVVNVMQVERVTSGIFTFGVQAGGSRLSPRTGKNGSTKPRPSSSKDRAHRPMRRSLDRLSEQTREA